MADPTTKEYRPPLTVPEYPTLDTTAVSIDHLREWGQLWREAHAELERAVAGGVPGAERRRIEFELRTTTDQSWAFGYISGRLDALRVSSIILWGAVQTPGSRVTKAFLRGYVVGLREEADRAHARGELGAAAKLRQLADDAEQRGHE